MTTTPAFEKMSITLPSETAAELRARVGRGELSSFVADTVARELRRRALLDALAESEREHGPVPGDVQAAADAEFDGAFDRAVNR